MKQLDSDKRMSEYSCNGFSWSLKVPGQPTLSTDDDDESERIQEKKREESIIHDKNLDVLKHKIFKQQTLINAIRLDYKELIIENYKLEQRIKRMENELTHFKIIVKNPLIKPEAIRIDLPTTVSAIIEGGRTSKEQVDSSTIIESKQQEANTKGSETNNPHANNNGNANATSMDVKDELTSDTGKAFAIIDDDCTTTTSLREKTFETWLANLNLEQKNERIKLWKDYMKKFSKIKHNFITQQKEFEQKHFKAGNALKELQENVLDPSKYKQYVNDIKTVLFRDWQITRIEIDKAQEEENLELLLDYDRKIFNYYGIIH